MIELREAKLLMAGRAGLFGILAEVFETSPTLENIDNLCKYMDDLLTCLEFTGGDDDMVAGYTKLSAWYETAAGFEKQWVEAKLAQEYALLFLAGDNILDRRFSENDNSNDEKAESIEVMLNYMAELSETGAKASNFNEIREVCASQKSFEDNFIIPGISDFCEKVYNKSPDYGVYQHIAVILHGFVLLDAAILNMFEQ